MFPNNIFGLFGSLDEIYYHRCEKVLVRWGSGVGQRGVAPGQSLIWDLNISFLICISSGCRISKVLWCSKNNTACLLWSKKNNSSYVTDSHSDHHMWVFSEGQLVVKVFGQRFDHYSSSDWSSSRKYWVRWRGSYSTMGTISSWPCWADLLPELRLQYWIGATSSASQSWKIWVSI